MSYSRPTISQILKRAKADLDDALQTQRSRLRYTVEEAIATVVAGASHTLHGHIAAIAQRVLPSPLDLVSTKLWGGLFGVAQNPAAFASGSILATGTASTAVPIATEWQREDGALFTTDAAATLDSNGTATIVVTASEAGADGNTDGGVTFTLTAPIANVDDEATVATDGITGGLGIESTSAYYGRLQDEVQRRPRGGGQGDYIGWALEVPGITQAWEVPHWLTVGNMGVVIANDTADGEEYETPSSAKVAEAQAYLETKRPATTSVLAIAVATDELNLTISNLNPDTPEVRAAIQGELRRMLREEADATGFTLPISKITEAISVAPGESSHQLTSPTVEEVYPAGTIPVLGSITWD